MATHKLFVANTKKQHHSFVIQTPSMGGNAGHKLIPQGQQAMVGEFDELDLKAIIAHHVRYGAREFGDGSRLKGFTGLVYRIDEPVNMDAMLETYDANDKALTQKADERRVAEAAAISDKIADTLHKATGLDTERVRPKAVELEIVEETDGKPAVAAGVQITPAGVAPTRQGRVLDRKTA